MSKRKSFIAEENFRQDDQPTSSEKPFIRLGDDNNLFSDFATQFFEYVNNPSLSFIHLKYNSYLQLKNRIIHHAKLNGFSFEEEIIIDTSSDLSEKIDSLEPKNHLFFIKIYDEILLEEALSYIRKSSIGAHIWIISPISFLNAKTQNHFDYFFFFEMPEINYSSLQSIFDFPESQYNELRYDSINLNRVLIIRKEEGNLALPYLETNPCILYLEETSST